VNQYASTMAEVSAINSAGCGGSER
jgi:hypothetical protein